MKYTFYLGHYCPTTRTDPIRTFTESPIPIPPQVVFYKSGLLSCLQVLFSPVSESAPLGAGGELGKVQS